MPIRRGKCINFGNCPKADAREIIEVREGGEFICPDPHCGKPLQPLGEELPPSWKGPAILGTVVI
jgi:phosphate transport system substrate-binding protein